MFYDLTFLFESLKFKTSTFMMDVLDFTIKSLGKGQNL